MIESTDIGVAVGGAATHAEAEIAPANAGRLVAGRATADALDDAELARLVTDDHLFAAVTDVQTARRTQVAAECRLLAEVEARRLYRREGHASLYGWLRAHFGFSDAECRVRVTIARASRVDDSIVRALAEGVIPIAHAEALSRVVNDCADDHRVDTSRLECELGFWLNETDREYNDYRLRIQEWSNSLRVERASRDDQLLHEQRYCRIRRRRDGTVSIDALLDPLGGSELLEVWAQQAGREFETDWSAAEAVHGDDTCPTLLARTNAQRQADALVEVARRAERSDGTVKPPLVNILIDEDSFAEAMIRYNMFPDDARLPRKHRLPAQRIARTNTGAAVDPLVAAQAALVGQVRFTMIDKLNRPLQTTSRQRLFTGAMREVIMAMSPTCCWPGCRRPVNDCQADHTDEHQHGGSTSITNGAPFCAKHNRFKSLHRYTPHQTRRGAWKLPTTSRVHPPASSSSASSSSSSSSSATQLQLITTEVCRR